MLHAESHADKRLKADPSDWDVRNNTICTCKGDRLPSRILNRRTILSEKPCASLANQITRPLGRKVLSTPFLVSANGTMVTCYSRVRSISFVRPSAPQSLADNTSSRMYQESVRHPSHPSFDTLTEITNKLVEADGKDYITAKRWARILIPGVTWLLHSSRTRPIRFPRVTAFGAW